MKRFVFLVFMLAAPCLVLSSRGQDTIPLNSPDLSRGLNVMKALSLRASVREYAAEKLSLQDLSDLLWAANGINRPEKGLRTAPSAINAQDIDVYVFLEEGVYLYDAKNHRLVLVANGDFRSVTGTQAFAGTAPVGLILVSDISRFRSGEQEARLKWAAVDAGIVSQNISVFCASTGLATVPRGSIDIEKVKTILKLTESQFIMLNHPVGYPVKVN